MASFVFPFFSSFIPNNLIVRGVIQNAVYEDRVSEKKKDEIFEVRARVKKRRDKFVGCRKNCQKRKEMSWNGILAEIRLENNELDSFLTGPLSKIESRTAGKISIIPVRDSNPRESLPRIA